MNQHATIAIADSYEVGKTGLLHLKRLWSKLINNCTAQYIHEQRADNNLLNELQIGLLPFYEFVYYQQPSFEALEDWILSVHTTNNFAALVQACNNLFLQANYTNHAASIPNVLSKEELLFWEINGYVIVRNAISTSACEETCQLLWEHLHMHPEDANSWYNIHPDQQGIMVKLFHHPQIVANRHSPIIRKAFEQLWNTHHLIVTADKLGFNPPERPGYTYRGAGMHWDVSLQPPIPFGTQGILYLTDTAANQGALRLVPGFQHSIMTWLESLPPNADPRKQDLLQLGVQHIAANAGDLIIWHHALPHDGSPNTAQKPRLVQYINWYNPNAIVQDKWV